MNYGGGCMRCMGDAGIKIILSFTHLRIEACSIMVERTPWSQDSMELIKS